MYYSGQTGRPYSYNFGTDVNGDGASTNDLLFYPRESDVTITNGTYAQLASFLDGGGCEGFAAGMIATRNSCRAPWTNTLDFRVAADVPIGRWRPEFTVDALNLLNLIDHTKGQVEYAAFNDLLVTTATEAAGRYAYTLNAIARPGGVRFARDDLRSRWQVQLGLRLRF